MRDDADRYRRYLAGDDNGLAEIIDAYHEGLSLYLHSFVKDICLAEEIMQETFVKLAVKKPKFLGKCSFKTWLYTIARNCALDHLRRQKYIYQIPLDECWTVSDETDIEQQYLKEEQKIELHRALQKIKPEYASVLYLMYFEDFDTEAIAGILHRSKRQVSDLLYRAKKALKSELEQEGFQYEKL